MTQARVGPITRVAGEVSVPGDKSISHRVLILAALARGRSYAANLSPAEDVARTAACLVDLGASVRVSAAGRMTGDGDGEGGDLRTPARVLDCGNSGTTMRLLAGLLAGHDLEAVLDGDASLRRRPMERVAAPLRRMGAEVEPSAAGTPPLRVRGRDRLRGGEHVLAVASAQLKSAILLAGLRADAPTRVVEPGPSRDHTERLLRLCGIAVEAGAGGVEVVPGPLSPFGLRVPGDLSSAAFLLALAAARPGSRLRCPGVTLNPGRTGFLEGLAAMGARVEVAETAAAGGVEPVGTVEVEGGPLRAATVAGDLVPRCIDELPVLAVLATQAEGTTRIAGAAELRVKESDRIAAVAAGLRRLGAAVEEQPDGLLVSGPVRLRPTVLDSGGDHRLAMAWAVAADLVPAGAGDSVVTGAQACAVSYPGFFADLARLARGA